MSQRVRRHTAGQRPPSLPCPARPHGLPNAQAPQQKPQEEMPVWKEALQQCRCQARHPKDPATQHPVLIKSLCLRQQAPRLLPSQSDRKTPTAEVAVAMSRRRGGCRHLCRRHQSQRGQKRTQPGALPPLLPLRRKHFQAPSRPPQQPLRKLQCLWPARHQLLHRQLREGLCGSERAMMEPLHPLPMTVKQQWKGCTRSGSAVWGHPGRRYQPQA
mmetsp:Transcript_40663/g.95563  ORF Transcript_40663/g.95563 Transcript_40663/m.95563 type:complete len:215 (-) Transcript_40663:231-875(-)